MKISFFSANREALPDAVLPYGVLCVIAATPAEHGREFHDLLFVEDPVAEIEACVRADAPDLVAIGLRNLQGNTYAGFQDNVAYYRALIRRVRSCTKAPIVLGGAGFSVLPGQLLTELGADFGICGEAERSFPALLEALEQGADPAELDRIPGLFWRSGGELSEASAAANFLSGDSLPAIDRGLVDLRYYSGWGIDSLQTKRGCSLMCDYCTYPMIEGRVTRRRSPAAIVDEFWAIKQAHDDVAHVFIVDSVFNLPPQHAKDICRELIERGPGLRWTCYANPLRFDDELAELMVAAGCAGVEVGSDSGNDEVLARLRKGFTTTRIQGLHDSCVAASLPDCHSFILATPGESLADVELTLEFIEELAPTAAIFGIWVDDREALDPELKARNDALRASVEERLLNLGSGHPNWIVPVLKINFDEQLFDSLRRSGARGPLWQVFGASARRRSVRRRPLRMVDQ